MDVGPTFSNDGTLLSFLRITDDPTGEQADFWLADADGSGQHRLAGPFLKPDWYDWSPARDAIAVQSTVKGKRVITIVPTDGSTPNQLDVGVEPLEPVWRAPDGHQLIFRGDRCRRYARGLPRRSRRDEPQAAGARRRAASRHAGHERLTSAT